MSALVLEPLLGDGFEAATTLEDTRLSVAFSGSGDMKAIALQADYLTRVHEAALRHSASEVRCDFRKLVFMNSSCFKSFVVWIDTLKNAPNAYKISFVTDPNLHWQRRSLEALRRLAMNIVSITTDAVD